MMSIGRRGSRNYLLVGVAVGLICLLPAAHALAQAAMPSVKITTRPKAPSGWIPFKILLYRVGRRICPGVRCLCVLPQEGGSGRFPIRQGSWEREVVWRRIFDKLPSW